MSFHKIVCVALVASAALCVGCERETNYIRVDDDSVVESAPQEATPAPETASAESAKPAEPVFSEDGKRVEIAVGDGEVFSGATDAARLAKVKVVRGSGRLSREGLLALSNASELVELLWSDAILVDEPGDAFAQLSRLPRLKKVRFVGLCVEKTNEFPSGALDAFGRLPALEDLDVSGSPLASLSGVDWKSAFPKLSRLNLYQTSVGNADVETLVPASDRLVWLNLDATQITPDCADALARFENLTFLHVGRTTLDDASLAKLGALKQLKKIHVTRTRATASGVDALRGALPNCEIVAD